MFKEALLTTSNIWRQPKCPINRRVDKENVRYTHIYIYALYTYKLYIMEYYSAIKKRKKERENDILPFTTT